MPSPRTVAPGVQADRLELAADRLDDDLLGVDDPVHDQAEAPLLGLQHRDDHAAVVPLGGQAQHVGEADQRSSSPRRPVDLRAADLLDGVDGLLGVEADQLLQADLRDGVAVAAHSTVSAGTIASVSGMRSRQTVPLPASDSTSMVPPMASMLVLTTSMPTPRPETLVTAAAGGEAGQEDQLRMSAGLIRSQLRRR